MDREFLAFAVIFAGFILWQLVTGKIPGNKSRPYATRLTNPLAYWLIIFGECAFLVVLVVIERMDQEPAQSSAPVEQRSASKLRRDEAFELHRAGRLIEAIAIYDELLRESNRNAELHYWRAMAHLKQQDGEPALKDLRRVIELQPTNFDAHLYADRILTQQQRWDEILEIWNQYLHLVPGDATAHFERGGTNYRKGDLAAARADAAEACRLGKAEGCTWAERLKLR